MLILEDDLLWSERLARGARALGHDAVIVRAGDPPLDADVGIVNLSSRRLPADVWIPRLRSAGVVTVAHAGHKDTEKLDAGRAAGADLVVTNGTLAAHLERVLADAAALRDTRDLCENPSESAQP